MPLSPPRPAAMTALMCGLAACLCAAGAAAQDRPQRIVSLNLCTDELLMRLVDSDRIASITYLSHQPQSAPPDLAELAARLPANRGQAEEVAMQDPDLVVAGLYAARATVGLLRRLGYRVVEFPPAADFDDIRANIRAMGEAVGEPERAEALIADMNARLAMLPGDGGPGSPVFAALGANLATPGRGTLGASAIRAAGYRPLGEALGYDGERNATLEDVILARPEVIAAATDWASPPAMASQILDHPALKALDAVRPAEPAPARLWACGSPLVAEAAEIIAGMGAP